MKDLLDVAGTTKTCGSPHVLGKCAASQDSVVVQRLRDAGAVIIGKTHLTELAFSGIGHIQHYDTPLSPFGRVPGGSSSGSGVAVSVGFVPAAIGTDTGGSVRIPAAWCGVTGFKPTVGKVPTDGCQCLSESFDSIGPLANSVEDRALLFRVMAGDQQAEIPLKPANTTSSRFLVPNLPFERVEDGVLAAFEAALAALQAAGASFVHAEVPELKLSWFPTKKVICVEAAATLAAISDHGDTDKLVSARIQRGAETKAVEYSHAISELCSLRAAVDRATVGFDAMLMPPVAITLPTLEHVLSSPEAMLETARACSSLSHIANGLKRCALSVPCHAEGCLPVGLMVISETNGDKGVLGCCCFRRGGA